MGIVGSQTSFDSVETGSTETSSNLWNGVRKENEKNKKII